MRRPADLRHFAWCAIVLLLNPPRPLAIWSLLGTAVGRLGGRGKPAREAGGWSSDQSAEVVQEDKHEFDMGNSRESSRRRPKKENPKNTIGRDRRQITACFWWCLFPEAVPQMHDDDGDDTNDGLDDTTWTTWLASLDAGSLKMHTRRARRMLSIEEFLDLLEDMRAELHSTDFPGDADSLLEVLDLPEFDPSPLHKENDLVTDAS